MRPDRPLILGMACLASGVGLLISYCQGATSMNAAYPFARSTMHWDMTINGPGALGGTALVAAGVLLLLWAVVAAFISQFRMLTGTEDDSDRYVDRDRDEHFEDEPYTGSLGISERRHTG